MRPPHLDGALILPVRLVYVYVARGADGELARVLVERDGLELGFFVDVGRLEDVAGRVKDDERITGDVGLSSTISFTVALNGRTWYNDLVALPQSMGDSLQLRLRPPGEDVAHGNCRLAATTRSALPRAIWARSAT